MDDVQRIQRVIMIKSLNRSKMQRLKLEAKQPNAINSLANYSQLQLEGAHNNGYSDLPENNAASDNSANDIYDNM
uniref:Uncharacterized protein n=1 Tax=Magallana gigas TaxID=29159 RepID=K1PM01_MAGGI